MFTAKQFQDQVKTYRKRFGLRRDVGFASIAQRLQFEGIGTALGKYPGCKTDGARVALLQMIWAGCRRYLDDLRGTGHGDPCRGLTVMDLAMQSRELLRRLLPEAKARARNNWLRPFKGLKKRLDAAPGARAKAQQGWNQVMKVRPQAGKVKVLEQEYWKEIFDPRHRPPHSVDDYNVHFDAWFKKAEPYLWVKDNPLDPNLERAAGDNPDYDKNFGKTFFEYLDQLGELGDVTYVHLQNEAERAGYEVIVQGDSLLKKSTRELLKTDGWELNNGFKNGDYPDSNPGQAMAVDHGIWVISTDGRIFSGPQMSDTHDMHHSGFLAGAPVLGGGEWLVRNGKLMTISGSSGHYKPSFEHFQNCLRILEKGGLNLSTVAVEWSYPAEDDYWWFNGKQIAMPGVKAGWLGWPKFTAGNRWVRTVKPLEPTQLRTPHRAITGDFLDPPVRW